MNIDQNTFRELEPHGDAMFPLMVHEFATDTRLAERVSCHWHEEIELLVVTEGSARLHIDERSYAVQKEEVLFIRSNHLHSISGREGVPFAFFAVVFAPALLNSYVSDGIQRKYLDALASPGAAFPEHIAPEEPWKADILRLLTEIRECYREKSPAFELLIKARLFEICYLLFSSPERVRREPERAVSRQVETIKAIIGYLRENYDGRVTLPELAARFAMSQGQLCRFFKSMAKMTVMEYLNDFRIRKSAQLLLETDWEIGEIAGRTGFNNISYYNKMFKRAMHKTPSAYRKQAATENLG